MSLLSFTDASKSYGDVPVLNGIKAGGLGGGSQKILIAKRWPPVPVSSSSMNRRGVSISMPNSRSRFAD